MDPTALQHEAIKQEWTDQYVRVKPDRPELKRFAGRIGRVITVNHNLKALVEFAREKDEKGDWASEDGGWYDITASEEYLRKVPAAEAKAKFKTENSALPFPTKQG